MERLTKRVDGGIRLNCSGLENCDKDCEPGACNLAVARMLASVEDALGESYDLNHIRELSASYDAMLRDLQAANNKIHDLRCQLEQGDWVSVKDRLPEEWVSVLVYIPDEAPMPTVREGYLSPLGFMVPALMQHIPGVSHWAEMPEPPRG